MSFEELMERHRTAVERLVKLRIESADVEDVLQETYLAAFRGFSELRGPEAFKPWILENARRRCADYYCGEVETLPIDEVPETRLTTTLWGREYMPAVGDAMDILRNKDRQIFRMFYRQELMVEQIVRRLKIPEDTVKSRLHTARGRFKELYNVKNGVNNIKSLPAKMPKYIVNLIDREPYEATWEVLPGWFIVPRPGEKPRWGIYESPSRKRTEWAEMKAVGPALIHGIAGVEIEVKQFNAEEFSQRGAVEKTERRFIA